MKKRRKKEEEVNINKTKHRILLYFLKREKYDRNLKLFKKNDLTSLEIKKQKEKEKRELLISIIKFLCYRLYN